jgi:hypothetical protein
MGQKRQSKPKAAARLRDALIPQLALHKIVTFVDGSARNGTMARAYRL